MNSVDLYNSCSPYSQTLGTPTIKFAEDNLCGYIAQPANTWSNVMYLVVAVMIASELKRAKNKTVLWGFVPVYLFIGFTSAFYHASATFVGQFFDFGSIYLFSAFILFLAINRINIFQTKKLLLYLSGVTLLMFVLLWFVPVLRIWLFAGQLAMFLWVELRLSKQYKIRSFRPAQFKNLYLALVIFFVAWTFWWLDVLSIWKDPATMHIFNGYALWHILTAISLYFVYRFYQAID